MLAIPEGITELKFQKIFMKNIMTEFKMKSNTTELYSICILVVMFNYDI